MRKCLLNIRSKSGNGVNSPPISRRSLYSGAHFSCQYVVIYFMVLLVNPSPKGNIKTKMLLRKVFKNQIPVLRIM